MIKGEMPIGLLTFQSYLIKVKRLSPTCDIKPLVHKYYAEYEKYCKDNGLFFEQEEDLK